MTTTTTARWRTPFARPAQGRWSFFGASSLPADPVARSHERRGRRWLLVSYLFCPCHIPVTLAVLGAVFGSSAIGAAITGRTVQIGVILTVIYAVVLWRGFRQIRRAKQIEASGGTLSCTSDGCEITERPTLHLTARGGAERTSAD